MAPEWDDVIEAKDWNFKIFTKGLKNLWELIGDQQARMRKVMIWQIGLSLSRLSLPLLFAAMVNELHNVATQQTFTLTMVGLLLTMVITKTVDPYLHHFVNEKIFIRGLITLENDWPAKAQAKLLELSLGWHETENTGKKIAKINKGIDRLIAIICDLRWQFIPPILYITINTIIMMIIDWRIGLLFTSSIPVAGIIYYFAWKKFAPDWEKWEKCKETSDGFFCQSLINIPTVINYVQEKREMKRIQEIREKMKKYDFNSSLGIQSWFYAATVIMHLALIGAITVGIMLFLKGESNLGAIAYLIITGTTTMELIWGVLNTYIEIMRKLISVERMKQLLNEKIDIPNSAPGKTSGKLKKEVAFKKAIFTYSGKTKPALDEINLIFQKGEITAIAGKSGSGKTTIIKALLKTHKLTNGQIVFDGINIDDLDLFWYRSRFAIVSQEVDIFDTTIKENIAYGFNHATDSQINESLDAAHLNVIINDRDRFPDGVMTLVGERGVRLSGGEKQRLGIARAYLALLGGAEILVLDEATSHLDSEAELIIQNMINKLRKAKNITMIVIAHRLSTIKKADHIYVLDEGQVIESGDHKRLVSKNGLYARLVELQQLGELKK